jgi:hypothetical protein
MQKRDQSQLKAKCLRGDCGAHAGCARIQLVFCSYSSHVSLVFSLGFGPVIPGGRWEHTFDPSNCQCGFDGVRAAGIQWLWGVSEFLHNRKLPLIKMLPQRGGLTLSKAVSGFSGFHDAWQTAEGWETAEAVRVSFRRHPTPLKQGVNERIANTGASQCVPSSQKLRWAQGSGVVRI